MTFFSTNLSFLDFEDFIFSSIAKSSSSELDFLGQDGDGTSMEIRLTGTFFDVGAGSNPQDFIGTVTNIEVISGGSQQLTGFGFSLGLEELLLSGFGSGLLEAVGLLDGPTQLFSDVGKDNLRGGQGRDEISTGISADVLFGERGNDKLYAGKGADKVSGGSGNDKIWGEGGNDKLFGGTGDDVINGGSGDDKLDGNDGNDKLRGGIGDDELIGREGDDILTGGAGADSFKFIGAAGANRITDFDVAEDILVFNPADQDLVFTNVGEDMLVEWDLGSVLVEGISVNEYFLG
ncbi:calcium-binding protein [Algirhabdus cladophorae]|uniref:calcium-binding protein n=1 Tax=Algirhabdus cladophorae TaxID=3377108 RepID=UPI003B84A83A